MRKIIVLLVILASCGYSTQGSDLVAQVKKVIDVTPIVCPDYTLADVSLGVIRNGVGSMSKEDMELYVPNADDAKLLKQAQNDGSLVRIVYDEARVRFCVPDAEVTSVTIEK